MRPVPWRSRPPIGGCGWRTEDAAGRPRACRGHRPAPARKLDRRLAPCRRRAPARCGGREDRTAHPTGRSGTGSPRRPRLPPIWRGCPAGKRDAARLRALRRTAMRPPAGFPRRASRPDCRSCCGRESPGSSAISRPPASSAARPAPARRAARGRKDTALLASRCRTHHAAQHRGQRCIPLCGQFSENLFAIACRCARPFSPRQHFARVVAQENPEP